MPDATSIASMMPSSEQATTNLDSSTIALDKICWRAWSAFRPRRTV